MAGLINIYKWGISSNNSAGINKRIVLTNFLLLILLTVFPLLYIIDTLFNTIADPYITIFIPTTSILFLTLNKYKKHVWGRTLGCFQLLFLPLYYSIYVGREGGIGMILIAIIPAAFIIFELTEWGKIVSYLISILLIGLALELTDYKLLPISFKSPVQEQISSIIPTYIAAVLCSSLFIYWLVNENRKAEKSLNKALIKAEESEQAKANFLSSMSHEIRTPLNGIITLADILKEDQSDYDQKIDALGKSAQHLLVLVNDILDFSKLNADGLHIDLSPFNLMNELTSINHLFLKRAEAKGLFYKFNFDKHTPLFLIGDSTRLRQVIVNFLDNAIKFTHVGGLHFKIETKSFSNQEVKISFQIIDTGIGIPSEKIESVFRSFEQGSISTNREFGGTGLGLTISKKIIHLMGGELFVDSSLNKGSTFTFEITFQQSNISTPTIKEIPSLSLKETKLPKPYILFVEDNEINQFVTLQIFKSLGAPYKICSSPKEALTLSQVEQFDLILTDYHMPEINGIELTKLIRSDVTNPNQTTPVILLTADVLGELDEACKSVGIAEIITKPINKKYLENTVLKFCKKDRNEDESSA